MTVVTQFEDIHDDLELQLDVLRSTLDLLELVCATQNAKPLLADMSQVSQVDCLVSYMPWHASWHGMHLSGLDQDCIKSRKQTT